MSKDDHTVHVHQQYMEINYFRKHFKVILYESVSHNVVLLHVLYLPILVNIIMIIQLEHTMISFSRSLHKKRLFILINPILHIENT